MNRNTGIIVNLAYPDTVVRPATGEFSRKIWPLFGVGGKNAVQAGHAAMLLISKESKEVHYFDFGRYVTSDGYGRVRGAKTDPEVAISIKAQIHGDALENLEELLLYLEAHPEITHGDGRLVASVNSEIDFDKAFGFIQKLQQTIEIPYGAFQLKASNCSRFVHDVLLVATTNFRIRYRLRSSKFITPSPISNVIRGRSTEAIFEVYEQAITPYTNRSVNKALISSLWAKVPQELKLTGTEIPDLSVYSPPNGQWLSGIGSGMWFEITQSDSANSYNIRRTCAKGKIEWEGTFATDQEGFHIMESYEFLHGSTCARCFIQQSGTTYIFDLKAY